MSKNIIIYLLDYANLNKKYFKMHYLRVKVKIEFNLEDSDQCNDKIKQERTTNFIWKGTGTSDIQYAALF